MKHMEIAFLLSFGHFFFLYVISERFTFNTQCHDFNARDSQHCKLMEWIEIGQSADLRRRLVAAVPDAPDASTRAFTLQRQPATKRSRPLRTHPDVVSVYRTNPTQWTQCVHGQPAANRSRTVSASSKIVSVYTATDTGRERERERGRERGGGGDRGEERERERANEK